MREGNEDGRRGEGNCNFTPTKERDRPGIKMLKRMLSGAKARARASTSGQLTRGEQANVGRMAPLPPSGAFVKDTAHVDFLTMHSNGLLGRASNKEKTERKQGSFSIASLNADVEGSS